MVTDRTITRERMRTIPILYLTYQSANSLSPVSSFVTDDFFGLLDDDEGGSTGLMDIGVGRFPVSTQEQARNAMTKTIVL